jgi:hypothetical protein
VPGATFFPNPPSSIPGQNTPGARGGAATAADQQVAGLRMSPAFLAWVVLFGVVIPAVILGGLRFGGFRFVFMGR